MEQGTHWVKWKDGWEALIHRDWVFSDRQIDRWETLAAGYGDAGIFLRPGWFHNWWEAFGHPGRLFVITLNYQGRTEAILPCWIRERGDLGKGSHVASLTNNHTYFYDFVINPVFRAEAVEKLLLLIRCLQPRTEWIIESLWDGFGNTMALEAQLKHEKFPFCLSRQPNSPYVSLSRSGWDAYYDSLHPKLRNNLRKGRNRSKKEGDLSFEIVEGPPRLEEGLTEALEVEHRSWKGKQGTAIKSKPEVERFYRSLARWAADRKCFTLFALRLNGRMIAFDFCVHGRETVFALKTGYDQMSYQNFSAGNLLRCEELRYLFEKTHYRQYNFLGLCTPWKMEWTAEHNTYAWFEVYQKSLFGWCKYGFHHGWKNHLKRYDSIRRFKAWMDNRMNRPG